MNPPNASATDRWISEAVRRQSDALVSDRRYIHEHPDPSGSEHGTADFIARRLSEFGLVPEMVLDGTGVTAELIGPNADASDRGFLVIRADIDALTITEADDGRPYRSRNEGVMHACGHDAHCAIALGVAALLSASPERLRYPVLFVFQPDEERIRGAQALIDAGVFTKRSVAGVLGLHVLSQMEVGTVGVRSGPIFASCDQFSLEIEGIAGHGGLPHRARDPIPVAAATVMQLQTLISRETSPMDAASVSVCSIHGGTDPTTIPGTVMLQGTVRAFDDSVRQRLIKRVEQMVGGVAEAAGMTSRLIWGASVPAVVNDGSAAELVRRAAQATPAAILHEIEPLPVADDVADLFALAPGCYFMLGAGCASRGIVAPHHHPDFDIDERCLPIGAEVFVRAILEFESGAPAGSTGASTRPVHRIDDR